MRKKTGPRTFWKLWPIMLLAACAWAPAGAEPGPALRIAVLEAEAGVALDEIVSGRARLGFDPVVDGGLHVLARPERTLWLRLRADLPTGESPLFLSLPRQQIGTLRLHRAPAADGSPTPAATTPTVRGARWPDAFVLPLPADASGPTTLYLEVRGSGYLNLQPRLLTAGDVAAGAHASQRLHEVLYGSLLVLFLLSLLRRWTSGEPTLRVLSAVLACLVAGIVGNQHMQLSVGGVSLASLGALPAALWVMACAPLLWATQQFAGHERTEPAMWRVLDRLGFGFLGAGVLLLWLPPTWLGQGQAVALALLAACSVVCALSLFSDPRQSRWGPILIWLAMLPALGALVLSMLQVLPTSLPVRLGFQLLLALQLAIYLLLPWLRRALHARAARRRRGTLVEQTAEEKIAHAREWMISSLQAGIEHAADGDMEWIAYRRLMAGLKTVLPQTGAAVIAMNYHNEDLLLVEPKAAQDRFRRLLEQRGSLLKNLSRSLAPQQIGVDFNGPDGPLRQVLLAIIPLPIERPGWGVLVIERSEDVIYSEDELDLCTEFAALATTAGDEAAEVMHSRREREIDSDSGAFRREVVEGMLARAHAHAVQQQKRLSVLRIGLDGFDRLPADATPSPLYALADLVREEIAYGDTIGRFAGDEFIVLLPARGIGEARALGERICLAARRHEGIAGGPVLLSVGVSQLQPGERSPQLLLERAGKALAKARQYGGNQVQAILSTTV